MQVLLLFSALLVALASAAPVGEAIHRAAVVHAAAKVLKATVKPVYREGGKNNPIGGAIRDADFHMVDNIVQPDGAKGLSMLNHRKEGPLKKGNAYHEIIPSKLHGTDFKAKPDGFSAINPKSRHPSGHVSLTYHGSPVSQDQMKDKIKALPWVKSV